MSIVIAAVGIVITLLLSVYERRREIGLLRAVGMTRGQVRSTVRWESVITSMLGAVLGVILGLFSGYLLVLSLRDEGVTVFTVPILSTIVILVDVVHRRGHRRDHSCPPGHQGRHHRGDRHDMSTYW